VTLRPATEADLPALLAILDEPDVRAWWGSSTLDREELDITRVIEVGGEIAGFMLCSEETDPMYRSVGLDISLASRFHGQGVGRAALRLAIDAYVARGHHRFTIDPRADNARAIRCYTAVGFRPVGVLRRYERGADGVWHDGLLMDLVVEEAVAPPST
jgi:aminoglycoside 6'-N-acetyltransferase